MSDKKEVFVIRSLHVGGVCLWAGHKKEVLINMSLSHWRSLFSGES